MNVHIIKNMIPWRYMYLLLEKLMRTTFQPCRLHLNKLKLFYKQNLSIIRLLRKVQKFGPWIGYNYASWIDIKVLIILHVLTQVSVRLWSINERCDTWDAKLYHFFCIYVWHKMCMYLCKVILYLLLLSITYNLVVGRYHTMSGGRRGLRWYGHWQRCSSSSWRSSRGCNGGNRIRYVEISIS